MPKQTSKSGLAAKYGNKLGGAVSNHAADSTEYSKFGELPGGIKNGIAQLVECKFDTYKSGDNEGEYYFIAAGVIDSPEFHTDGSPLKGLRTQIMEPVCDTKTRGGKVTTQDEHVANVLNEMRKLGADTNGVEAEQLEDLAASLKEAAPYFRFNTSQGEATAEFPNPRVWQNWNGGKGLEDYSPEAADEVEDDTEADDAEEEAPKAKTPMKGKGKPAPEPEPEADTPFGDDLDDLVAEANGKDKTAKIKATNRLNELAIEKGYSEDEVNGADNWEAVAELIRNPKEEDAADDDAADDGVDYLALGESADKNDKKAAKQLTAAAEVAGLDSDEYDTWSTLAEALSGEGGAAEESEFEPTADGVYLYKGPLDKKAKEYNVVKINSKNRTVTLKDGDTMKPLNDPKTKQPIQVSWDDLTEE